MRFLCDFRIYGSPPSPWVYSDSKSFPSFMKILREAFRGEFAHLWCNSVCPLKYLPRAPWKCTKGGLHHKKRVCLETSCKIEWESGKIWEVLHGVGVDGVGGTWGWCRWGRRNFLIFLFFFCFFAFFSLFVFLCLSLFSLILLVSLLFFFVFPRFASLFSSSLRGQGEMTAIYCKNGEFHSDPVCTDPVQNFPKDRKFSGHRSGTVTRLIS